ncbi:MAG TPA: alpha/beta fold hydrolase [Candidatus Limnocylindria bacterium]
MLATHEWPPSGADASDARTAVLVHGVTGWHRTWWRVGPALAARGWRVIAVDQRGHGHSPRIDRYTTVGEWAADLATAIERIGAPVDALIGHSLGAAVSAEVAFLRGDLVRRLVLEDPPAVTRADDVVWHASLESEHLAAVADPEGEVARTLAENPTWLEEDARQDVEGRQLADLPGLLATFRRDTGARVLELAPRLAAPALYLLAAEDRSVFGGAARRQLEDTLPTDARMVVLDAGHTIHRDRFDEYVDAVLGWIRGA